MLTVKASLKVIYLIFPGQTDIVKVLIPAWWLTVKPDDKS